MPRVSIIIPTYNLAHYIGRTLATVFCQTYTDYEVIVADDGSTDDTRTVLAPWDGRIRYFYQANRGVAAARNLALSNASGEFIAYVDADDMWYPQKLERQVHFLDRHRECGIVHSDCAVVDEADTVLYPSFNRDTHREVPQGQCLMVLLRHCHIQPLTILERRECVDRTGGFDERLRGVDDYLRWILLAIAGVRFGYIDESLAMYRWRKDQFSALQAPKYFEAFLMMFDILLDEKRIGSTCGEMAADLIHAQRRAVLRDLAYLDRTAGRMGRARRRVFSLIRQSPFQPDLYLDLFKSCVPPPLVPRVRGIKRRPA
jgi:glycosyltransferase involved in cell wall biosynthesis